METQNETKFYQDSSVTVTQTSLLFIFLKSLKVKQKQY